MAEIVKIKKDGVIQYPITKPECVIDENGKNVLQLIKENGGGADIDLSDYLTKSDAEETYQPKENIYYFEYDGTDKPVSDYLTEAEIEKIANADKVVLYSPQDGGLLYPIGAGVQEALIVFSYSVGQMLIALVVYTNEQRYELLPFPFYNDTEVKNELARLEREKADKSELTELSTQVGKVSEEMANKQDVYVAEYGVTTREQIKAAWEANKHIVCVYGNKLYNLTNYGDVYDICFACVYYSVELLILSVAGNWGRKTISYESTANKTKTINESSTDTQYPSAKAVYDFVSNTLGTIINGDY